MKIAKRQKKDLSGKENASLKKNQIFKNFTNDILNKFICCSKKISYKKGKVICSELSIADKIFFYYLTRSLRLNLISISS